MTGIFRAHTLQKYVLREFWKVFALALAACTLFMLIATLFIKAREWEEYGVTAGRLALLSPYLLPQPLAHAIPLATMIAVIMVFGRLMAENEMLAVQASGAPIRVLAVPVFFSALLLSGVSLWCQQAGLEWGISTIRYQILKLDKPEAFLDSLQKEGSWVQKKLENGSLVRINMLPHTRDPQSGAVRRPIHIAYFTGHDVGRTILAADHEYDPSLMTPNDRVLVLKLKQMQVLGLGPSFTREIVTELRLPPLDILGDSRGQKGWWQNYQDGQEVWNSIALRRHFLLQRAGDFGAQVVAASTGDPAGALLNAAAWSDGRFSAETISGAVDRARAEEVECQRKLALSFLPLSLCAMGVGLGLLVRKSQRLVGFLLGIVVYALGYYPLMILCKEVASGETAGPWLIWLPNAVLWLAGYFMWRGFERGWIGGLPDFLSAMGPAAANTALRAGTAAAQPFAALRDWAVTRLRGKVDGYVSGAFLVPLLVVLLTVAVLFTAMDLVERGSSVIEGIVLSGDKVQGRTHVQALLDVMAYYSISSIEWICELLPLLILIAGVLCVYMLVRNSEHLILKSSGVRLQRAFRPIIVTALIFSVFIAVLRETLLPSMIMARSQLKQLVYNRNPYPTALALYTTDSLGKPVLFEMSNYSPVQRSGKNLRVYLLAEEKNGRIPAIVADKAAWCGDGWSLQIEPKKTAEKGGKAAPASPLLNYGYQIENEELPGAAGTSEHSRNANKKPLAVWKGGVTPSIIESERLGPGVMTLQELNAAGSVKRDFAVEIWHRLPEVLMAVFLLWAAIPLLLHEEVRRPLLGVGLCILLGGLYWTLNMGAVEAARDNYLPIWGPLIPHIAFLIFGYWQYNIAMET